MGLLIALVAAGWIYLFCFTSFICVFLCCKTVFSHQMESSIPETVTKYYKEKMEKYNKQDE